VRPNVAIRAFSFAGFFRNAIEVCGGLGRDRMDWFFKDFGPTIIASATAAYFVRQQWKTAEKQAETSID
jgi:hypothetical protein